MKIGDEEVTTGQAIVSFGSMIVLIFGFIVYGLALSFPFWLVLFLLLSTGK